MNPLVVTNLSKSFGGLQALQDVSFSVDTGERLVIIGPNGAGKTTLFSLISGSLQPSRGRIAVFGEDVTDMPPHRRVHLGMTRTFQITNLFPNLTLYRNILLAVLGAAPKKFAMGRPISYYKDVIARTRRFLKDWSLEENQHSLVRNLSYGTQRQAEVIMALACEGKLLLLDEPTSGMSAAETSAFVSMILGMDEAITLMIIEHDMDVAFQLAHKIIVLHNGTLIAEGPPEKIASDPRVREIYLGER
jgi:branched-chain amino acid transport system ATP-binding protein